MSRTASPHRLTRATHRHAGIVTVVAAMVLLVLLSGLSVAQAAAGAPPRSAVGAVARAEDDEVVLPTRVAAAIDRAQAALGRTANAIDDRRRPAARRAMAALIANLRRAHLAGMAQLSAVPMDPEAETTAGPDSVVAVLTLEQLVVARLGNLYDGVRAARLVARLNRAARVAGAVRIGMLNAVIALDPEGAGADYADGMADTVDGYTDEVATLQEALATDRLIPSARTALTAALSRSLAAQAAVTAAFGGGE